MSLKKIKFTSLKLRGIRSFQNDGNNYHKIRFDQGNTATFMEGDNGTGKTTIIEALIFALTGGLPSSPKSDLMSSFIADGAQNIDYNKKAGEIILTGTVDGKSFEIYWTLSVSESGSNKKNCCITYENQTYSVKINEAATKIGDILGLSSKKEWRKLALVCEEEALWPLNSTSGELKKIFDQLFELTDENRRLTDLWYAKNEAQKDVTKLSSEVQNLKANYEEFCEQQKELENKKRCYATFQGELPELITIKENIESLKTTLEQIQLKDESLTLLGLSTNEVETFDIDNFNADENLVKTEEIKNIQLLETEEQDEEAHKIRQKLAEDLGRVTQLEKTLEENALNRSKILKSVEIENNVQAEYNIIFLVEEIETKAGELESMRLSLETDLKEESTRIRSLETKILNYNKGIEVESTQLANENEKINEKENLARLSQPLLHYVKMLTTDMEAFEAAEESFEDVLNRVKEQAYLKGQIDICKEVITNRQKVLPCGSCSVNGTIIDKLSMKVRELESKMKNLTDNKVGEKDLPAIIRKQCIPRDKTFLKSMGPLVNFIVQHESENTGSESQIHVSGSFNSFPSIDDSETFTTSRTKSQILDRSKVIQKHITLLKSELQKNEIELRKAENNVLNKEKELKDVNLLLQQHHTRKTELKNALSQLILLKLDANEPLNQTELQAQIKEKDTLITDIKMRMKVIKEELDSLQDKLKTQKAYPIVVERTELLKKLDTELEKIPNYSNMTTAQAMENFPKVVIEFETAKYKLEAKILQSTNLDGQMNKTNELVKKYSPRRDEYLKQKGILETKQRKLEETKKKYETLRSEIINIHQTKITNINEYLKDRWEGLYHRDDVSTILLKAELESADETRVCYEYCFEMKISSMKELKMRGRSSYGEKHWASIIIRCALLDLFQPNCPFLAFDVPDANLDPVVTQKLYDHLNQLTSIADRHVLITSRGPCNEKVKSIRPNANIYYLHKDLGSSTISPVPIENLNGVH